MKRKALMLLCSVLLVTCVSACATLETSKKVPYRLTRQGMVIWEDEFEFKPPPAAWKIIQTEAGGEFSFGFLRQETGQFPCQSMFVYDEDPFGASGNLDVRQEEFFKRFLWGTCLKFQVLEKNKIQVVGGEGLAVIVEGKDTVKKEKVKAKVVFTKRGERVVSFYITQWRSIGEAFDPSAFEVFDQFVGSFKFLKKSFYETL